jgi:outer membrane lipoprotein-sorting protein
MGPAENIEKLITNADMDTNTKVDQATLDDVLKALENSKRRKSAKLAPNIWRTIMKSGITKLAAAAVIVVGVLVAINEFGDSVGVATVIWAKVAENVEKAEAFMYRMKETETRTKKQQTYTDERERTVYVSSKYGLRMDNYRDGQVAISTYSLPAEKAIITVCHPMKIYTYNEMPEKEIESLRQTGPIEIVKRFISGQYKELGRDVIGGVEVEGFEVDDLNLLEANFKVDNFISRLWIDTETGFPVLIENEVVGKVGALRTSSIMDQFEWNVDLGPELFEPNIPPDYASMEGARDSKTKPEEQPPAEGPEAQQWIAQLDLPDLSELNLLGLARDEPNVALPDTDMKEIWRMQNETMASWPDYLEVAETLQKELWAKLDMENLSKEKLVAAAVALRERFWQAGGCLSRTSYPYGYGARILFEIAHEENPHDMAITDELVEALQSIDIVRKYDPDSDEKTVNIALRDTLIELRAQQFEQLKNELGQGRQPVWADFVRVNDLALLLGLAGEYESALEVAKWLIANAESGGLTAYMEPLKDMHRCFSQGEHFFYNIQGAKGQRRAERFRYTRRLPSFKGPRERGVTPVHLLHPKPIWR